MPVLIPLPLVSEPPPLCRALGPTCAACCFGEAVARPTLERALRRQASLFRTLVKGRPTRWRLLLHELLARGGTDLFWGLLLLLPLVGDLLRPWLKRRTVCAFLAFEAEGRVGCLLHPSRWAGRDLRNLAFALRLGFGCGPAAYLCRAGHSFRAGGWGVRWRFLKLAEGLDWFRFSQVVRKEDSYSEPDSGCLRALKTAP